MRRNRAALTVSQFMTNAAPLYDRRNSLYDRSHNNLTALPTDLPLLNEYSFSITFRATTKA